MADSVYWTNYADNAIRGAPLAGGGAVETLYELRPRRGRSDGDRDLRRRGAGLLGQLRGRCNSRRTPRRRPRRYAVRARAGRHGPGGVAIDPAAGRIYWANEADDTIRAAALGGGGGVPSSLYQGTARGVSSPGGVAIDPAAARIYWANGGDDTIRAAPLSGGGNPVALYGPGNGVSGPYGLAIDLTAGRIYWANVHDNTIRGAPLAGGGSVDTLYGPAEGVNAPYAVAIDPADAISIVRAPPSSALARWVTSAIGAIVGVLQSLERPDRTTIGRIYWTNNGDNTIRGAGLAIRGAVDVLYGGPGRGVNWPYFLAGPCSGRTCGTRDIGRGAGLGQPLSCSRGAWAGDLAGASLFRAPQSFAYQWIRGGSRHRRCHPPGPSRRPLPAAMPAGSPPSIGPGHLADECSAGRLIPGRAACSGPRGLAARVADEDLVLSRRRARYACVLRLLGADSGDCARVRDAVPSTRSD